MPIFALVSYCRKWTYKLAERTENPCVGGSNPPLPIRLRSAQAFFRRNDKKNTRPNKLNTLQSFSKKVPDTFSSPRFLVQPRDRCLFRNAGISLGESGLCHSFLPFREGLLQSRDICCRKHSRGPSSGRIRVFSSTGVALLA